MDNFYTSIKNFCFSSQLFGFFPMSFEGPVRKGIFKVKFINLVITVTSLSIILIFSSRAIDVGIASSQENFFRARVWTYILILGLLWTYVHFAYQIGNLKNTLNFFHLLHQCDLKLYVLNSQVDFKKEAKFITMASISPLLLTMAQFVIAMISSYFLHTLFGVFYNIMYSHFLMYKCFFFAQFVIFAHVVNERFKALNHSIM